MSKNALVTFKTISNAELVYKKLRGLFCVYKPPEMDIPTIANKLRSVLSMELNMLPQKPTEQIVKVDDQDDVYLDTNFADTKEGD